MAYGNDEGAPLVRRNRHAEKDAVSCIDISGSGHWFIPLAFEADLSAVNNAGTIFRATGTYPTAPNISTCQNHKTVRIYSYGIILFKRGIGRILTRASAHFPHGRFWPGPYGRKRR